MFAVGSYGTKNAKAIDALITIAGPPLTFIAGIGLLRRKRVAWFTLVAILIAILGWQASEVFNPPPAAGTTFIDANGVPTTIMGGGPTYSMPVIAVCIAALAILFSPKSRAEFAAAQVRHDPPAFLPRAERSPAATRDTTPAWRVGHRGRDQMFYEEQRDGQWQGIVVDGEMLMGRPHHVIYFASAETWQRYPEWARQRRDEIIARIKNEFREPDYEYADGGTASSVAMPAPLTPVSHGPAQPKAMTSSEFRALLAFLAIFLGIASGMAWLVVSGLQRDETFRPAKRASQQRAVSREKEPAMFWTSIGVYSGIGLGSLWLAGCFVRWSRK